jgi:DNA-binding CsgD family transcriptional regulator
LPWTGQVCEIKKELDEHLSTINENTNELQANYEFLLELDAKIQKLNERLDGIQMLLDPKFKRDEAVYSSPLTKREQEVFLIIYTTQDSLLTYRDIARRMGLSETMIENYVANLIMKGIPILKTYRANRTFLRLDEGYRQKQAKSDILKLNEAIAARLFNSF